MIIIFVNDVFLVYPTAVALLLAVNGLNLGSVSVILVSLSALTHVQSALILSGELFKVRTRWTLNPSLLKNRVVVPVLGNGLKIEVRDTNYHIKMNVLT